MLLLLTLGAAISAIAVIVFEAPFEIASRRHLRRDDHVQYFIHNYIRARPSQPELESISKAEVRQMSLHLYGTAR